MDSTTLRMQILKSSGLFAELPPETLQELALLLSPVEFAAGALIFREGDQEDWLYIIVQGRVRVHTGERTLNYLGKYDVFGEMALLDRQRRSASATALEDTALLRLDHDPFYAFMSDRVEVAFKLIHVLSQYLRARLRELAEDYDYLRQLSRLTAAASAVEAGIYEPDALAEVVQRDDALGQLGRVFQQMMREVYAREQALRQEVEELRIKIDQSERDQKVAEITETEYFQMLQEKVEKIRKR